MKPKSFFFAGGGTGGHIYPAIAVAEKLLQLEPSAQVHFFCSNRQVDELILSKTGFEYTKLPAEAFSLKPQKLIGFLLSFSKSYRIAKEKINKCEMPMVIGIGGFVAAPVCLVGHRLKKKVALINTDAVPGKANRFIARLANTAFLQFDETVKHFSKCNARVAVVGCPLRSSFENPQPQRIKEQLALDANKKTLLITGASSGSARINEAVLLLLDRFAAFADQWQIVHLTGLPHYQEIKEKYTQAKIDCAVMDYVEDMADLLAAADLVIGRSGAVSVAEYAAAATPSICMPYPYHKDRHQYFNAEQLVSAGAGVVVDDFPNAKERADWLWEELQKLLTDHEKLDQMRASCTAVAKTNAATKIAQKLLTDD